MTWRSFCTLYLLFPRSSIHSFYFIMNIKLTRSYFWQHFGNHKVYRVYNCALHFVNPGCLVGSDGRSAYRRYQNGSGNGISGDRLWRYWRGHQTSSTGQGPLSAFCHHPGSLLSVCCDGSQLVDTTQETWTGTAMHDFRILTFLREYCHNG